MTGNVCKAHLNMTLKSALLNMNIIFYDLALAIYCICEINSLKQETRVANLQTHYQLAHRDQQVGRQTRGIYISRINGQTKKED